MQEEYNNILKQINEILIDEDLMGLIKGCGAPLDEYESEGQMIFERINRYNSVDQILDVVYNVFYIQFCYGTSSKVVNGIESYVEEVVVPFEEADKHIGLKERHKSAAQKIYKIFNP